MERRFDHIGESPWWGELEHQLDGVTEIPAEFVQATDDAGRTPLHFAAGHGRIDLVERLISAGANVDMCDRGSSSPEKMRRHFLLVGSAFYAEAIERGEIVVGSTPLMEAARFDQSHAARALVESGASINLRDLRGYTALKTAVERNALAVSAELLNLGADAGIGDHAGEDCLTAGIRAGSMDIIELLLGRSLEYLNLSAALAEAQRTEQLDVARKLLDCGADPEGRASGAQPGSLLSRAAHADAPGWVQLLLDHGADPNRVGPDGVLPLWNAVAPLESPNAVRQSVRILLNAGADPERSQPDGATPIAAAVEAGCVGAVEEMRKVRDIGRKHDLRELAEGRVSWWSDQLDSEFPSERVRAEQMISALRQVVELLE